MDANGWEWGTDKERRTICEQAGAGTGGDDACKTTRDEGWAR